MYAVLAEIFIGVAVAGLATVQWIISRRDLQRQIKNAEDAEKIQFHLAENDRVRLRDSNLAVWGGGVIDLMSELEVVCLASDPGSSQNLSTFKELEHRASALVDRGRLFFPNVESEGIQEEGVRVEILDHVLRACYVARHLGMGQPADQLLMRHHVWQARRNFVRLLQGEIKQSLRVVNKESAGESVPLDPTSWPTPRVRMRLPPFT